MLTIGIIGKTNTGKTTFFNSATMLAAEISTRPFTTVRPNEGIGRVSTPCVCAEFGVKDDPRNSVCINGWRFLPIVLIDLPGLIKGAWMGKGLGNQFLSVAATSDALLHIVDISGSIDAEGRIVEPGVGDPIADYYDIEEEVGMWYFKTVRSNFDKVMRSVAAGVDVASAFAFVMAGMKVKRAHVEEALKKTGLAGKDLGNWDDEDLKKFAFVLREVSKPTVVVANKMDLPGAEANYKKMAKTLKDVIVIPACAEAELALRRAEQKGLVRYVPGEESFQILDEKALDEKQRWALEYMERFVFSKIMRTGVQYALNTLTFKLMGYKVVYPVANEKKLSDTRGRVLPDAFLLEGNATLTDLARAVHTDIARTLLYGIDVRTGLHLPANYVLKHNDVVKLVAAAPKRRKKREE